MPPSRRKPKNYRQLKQKLQGLLEQSQQGDPAQSKQYKITAYWNMGKILNQNHDPTKHSPQTAFFKSLAKDLNIETSLLYRIQQFHQCWPKTPPLLKNQTPLSWSHHKEILTLDQSKAREFYLKQASQAAWTLRTLRQAIKHDLYNHRPPSGKTWIKLKPKQKKFYLYQAQVKRVVDGDTLLVLVDLGFDNWTLKRLRLQGVNTSELNGEEKQRAQAAKTFVEAKLQDIEQIVIQTQKTDLHGRYVAHVFYHPALTDKEEIFAKGYFLNQQLLEAGLAEVMV